MATKTLTTNLKLIESILTVPPTTAQLPKGYMAFGLVNGKPSIWGNYNNTVVDLIQAGSPKVEIVQGTGNSITAVMSQNATTAAYLEAIDGIFDLSGQLISFKDTKNKANGFAGLDANAKILPAQLPDYIMNNLLFGGTIAQNGLATLTAAFKSKYGIAANTLQMTATNYAAYPGAYFIAQDTVVFTNVTIIGVLEVSTGDWIISLGTQWSKVDTTDSVVTVNGRKGIVTITLEELGGVATAGGYIGATTSTFIPAGTRSNIASGTTIATMLGIISKWYSDFGGLAWKSQITPTTDIASGLIPIANIPIAASASRGAVIVPASASGLTVDTSGNIRALAGNGMLINASNQLEADVAITFGVI